MLEPPKKLIVCAVAKPVELEKPFGGETFEYNESDSGLAASVRALERSGVNVRWVAWPGCFVEKTSEEGVRQRLEEEYNCHPVFLDRAVEELFYARFCHGVLWPLFHCIPMMTSLTKFEEGEESSRDATLVGARATDQYEAYLSVNQLYLEAVAAEYVEGDLVLVHDYELMLLPAMLRSRFPEISCGYFCNCPFPSTEFYRMLPAREALLRGALGADLVSFNHFDYVRHFLNACMRVLGLESLPSRLEYNGRLVTVSICPAGIAPEAFEVNTDSELSVAVRGRADQMRAGPFKHRKVLLSLDALDMSKGIPQRLLALEALLEFRPEWRGRAILVLAARDRGRVVDAQLRKAVDGLVGHVNGRFGRADYCPVHYLKHTLTRVEKLALYSLADVALVASVREGINLSAMEFVAVQNAFAECERRYDPGVLVYSEFAGCATSFEDGALVVNPHDTDGVAQSLHAALTMTSTTKQVRHHKLARYVNTYTAELWSNRLVKELRQAREKAAAYEQLLPLDVAQLRSFYERSRRRLLVFEYDGTLAPHASLPQLAQPPPALAATLAQLCADPHNTVYVLSGRSPSDLDEWLGSSCPRLGLVAEMGFRLKRAPRCALPSVLTFADSSAVSSLKGSAQTLTGLETTDAELLANTRLNALAADAPVLHDDDYGHHAGLDDSGSGDAGDRATDDDATDDRRSENDVARDWEDVNPGVDTSWVVEVAPILESFTRQTPGSFLEANGSCVTWHYRDADPDFGDAQAKNLILHLEVVAENRPVKCSMSATKRQISLQPARVSKGRALRGAVGVDMDAYDLVFVVGGEADEDVFELFEGSSHSFTVSVGRHLSRASFFLDDEEVLPTLQTLAAVSNLSIAPNPTSFLTSNTSFATAPDSPAAP